MNLKRERQRDSDNMQAHFRAEQHLGRLQRQTNIYVPGVNIPVYISTYQRINMTPLILLLAYKL